MKPRTSQIVEIVGVIAVVFSLLFVGFEVQQNSDIARTEAFQNYQDGMRELSITVATDPFLAPLIVKINNGVTSENLTEVEILRLAGFFLAGLRIWEEIYRAYEAGTISEERLSVMLTGRGSGYDSSVFNEFWESSFRESFDGNFAQYFESLPWFTATDANGT